MKDGNFEVRAPFNI